MTFALLKGLAAPIGRFGWRELPAIGGTVGGATNAIRESRDDDGFDILPVIQGIGSGLLAGSGLKVGGIGVRGAYNKAAGSSGRMGKAAKSLASSGAGRTAIGAGIGAGMLGIPAFFQDDESKKGNGKPPLKSPFAASAGMPGSAYDPIGPSWLQARSSIGDQISGSSSSKIPDYFSYMNDPRIAKLVAADVASMQSPLRRSIKTRKELRSEGEASTRKGMEEFQRVSRNLRKESRAATNEYQEGAANRKQSAEDAMTRVADRLLAGGVSSDTLAQQRATESAQELQRTQNEFGREVERSSRAMESSPEFMSDLAALEEMESARDIRDANRQKERDIDEINAQIADIAGQAPSLRQKYAAGLADYEMEKYKLQSDSEIAAQKALQDLMIEQAKAASKAGVAGEDDAFSKYITRTRDAQPSREAIVDPESEEKIGTLKLMDLVNENPTLQAALARAYGEQGDVGANSLLSWMEAALAPDSGYTIRDIEKALNG